MGRLSGGTTNPALSSVNVTDSMMSSLRVFSSWKDSAAPEFITAVVGVNTTALAGTTSTPMVTGGQKGLQMDGVTVYVVGTPRDSRRGPDTRTAAAQ